MKTILVCGHGPGISDAVARRFGREGFHVGLVARSGDRLATAAESLRASGLKAQSFACDLADEAAVRATVAKAREALGGIGVLFWNAYATSAGDVLTAPIVELRRALDVSVIGLVTAVQAALADLKEAKGAVLATNGGFGLFDAGLDGACVKYGAMGLGIANAAKHKTTRLLHQRLASEGVFLGEVMVMGTVKGTAFDHGDATIEPAAVAERFWQMVHERKDATAQIR